MNVKYLPASSESTVSRCYPVDTRRRFNVYKTSIRLGKRERCAETGKISHN